MKRISPITSLAIVLAAPCIAQVDANPAWAPRPQESAPPDPSILERYYPQRARDQGVSGRVVIDCAITPQGALSGCRVISESPRGMGFGEASVRAATRLRVRTHGRSGNGAPGARIQIPLDWRLDEPPAEIPQSLPIPTGAH